nr:major capsid protein [uncultured Mediterranean phage uvMED]
MSEYINESLLDASPIRKQKDESAKLVAKWDKSGLLEGMENDWEKSGMAVLLENQARQLISENSKTSPNAGGGVGDEEWSGVALPLVRRVFGNIVAQELVSVQPMNLPSGLVFYLDFKYGTSAGKFSAGGSLAGKTGPNSPSGSSAPFGEDALYGVGKYGYSANLSTEAAIAVAATPAAATFKDIDFNSEDSASISNDGLVKIAFAHSGLTNPDLKAVRSFDITLNNTSGSILPQYTKVNGANIEVIADMNVGGSILGHASGSLTVDYIVENTAGNRGDFEDRIGKSDDAVDLGIPEVNLEMRSLPIVAKTRKLKAVWSPELAQDLNAYHSVDAEAELTSMLSDYIAMEIDLEILDMLVTDAQTEDYWSASVGKVYDSATTAFVSETFYGTKFEWYQTLVAKIQKVSNEIHRLTLRGGANFVVVAPKVATILESLPGYVSQPGDGGNDQFSMGISKIGQAAGRYTVYKNPYMTENSILVGFRGSNFLETGAVYSPYVPLITTPLVYDAEDFTPRKGVMTRYAKKMIRPEFYGLIHCSALDTI